MVLETFCCFRFLYPIYPLICVAASAVIESFPDLFGTKHDLYDNVLVKVILTARGLLFFSQLLHLASNDLLFVHAVG